MIEFQKARTLFKEIKARLESVQYNAILNEFLRAIDRLISEYDTAVYENRFVVGGAIEHIFSALLRSLGFKVEHTGSRETRSDLIINGVGFSIKTNFSGGGDIRLINKLGEGEVLWNEPTIFIVSGLGCLYGDPALLKDKTKDTGDALVINVSSLKELSKDEPEFLISLNIPKKTYGKTTRTASLDVALAILMETGSKYLIKYLE